jgi:myo-inositol-1(or 4)-monophosphatase
VTVADWESERLLRAMIHKRHPDHGIIAEEFGNEREDAEYVWVLDPIDGTISFVAGVPLFGILIGLLHRGRPVAGCIFQPVLNFLCLGDGRQAWMNGNPVRVRETDTLAEAELFITDYESVERFQDVRGFDRLRHGVKRCRTWGDCFGYLLLASGKADIMLDPVMKSWDLLPLIPVIQGAGGVITDWRGNDPVAGTSCVAAVPGLHGRVLEVLNVLKDGE